MPTVDLVMPKMGESIMEATILKWHKQPGDKVKMDETILEIATDKVDSEVPSTAEGVIDEILFNVNDVVAVGTVIARIKSDAEVIGGSRSQQAVYKPLEVEREQPETISHTFSGQSNFNTSSVKPSTVTNSNGNRF